MNCVTCPTLRSSTCSARASGPLAGSAGVVGLVGAISIFCALIITVVLVPLAVAGARDRMRSADFGPFFLYAALLFGASGFCSPSTSRMGLSCTRR